MGGGGDTDSTTTTNASYPDESKPLFRSAVEDILQAQGLLPIASFTQYQPGGTAGIAPAHTFGMETLLPAAMRPTAGMEALLQLGQPVGQAAHGAVGASGPMGAEQMAMQRLLGLDPVSAARPGEFSLGGRQPSMPNFHIPYAPMSTVFPGISAEALQGASRDVARGSVPVMGGWGLDQINPTAPMRDLPAPTSLTAGGYSTILPPDARDQFQTYVDQGYQPGPAYRQALKWLKEQEEAAEAGQQPAPITPTPPPFSPDGSPGGL